MCRSIRKGRQRPHDQSSSARPWAHYAPIASGRMGLLALAALSILSARAALSDEPAATEANAAQAPAVAGTRRALIICGHPGDEEHRAAFVKTVDSLRRSLVERLGFLADDVGVLFGGEETPDGASRPAQVRGPSTTIGIAAEVDALKLRIQPDDALWVIVLGHSHRDGRRTWFNVPGPDLDETALGRLFEGVVCREQVFWITIPTSGFFIKPLSAPGRVVVTATEADLEINETTFPHVLAEMLSAPWTAEMDADQDGQPTLLDLYVTVARRIAEAYGSRMELATEHAQLDDNGDGRGTEVQLDYLSAELGGRGASPAVPRPATADGAASAGIRLPMEIVDQAPLVP